MPPHADNNNVLAIYVAVKMPLCRDVLFSIGSSVVPIIVYFASNAFFTYLDLTGKPAALLKYKIQEEKGVPVSFERVNLIATDAWLGN